MRHKQRGFSFLETFLVLAIIGLLSTSVLMVFSHTQPAVHKNAQNMLIHWRQAQAQSVREHSVIGVGFSKSHYYLLRYGPVFEQNLSPFANTSRQQIPHQTLSHQIVPRGWQILHKFPFLAENTTVKLLNFTVEGNDIDIDFDEKDPVLPHIQFDNTGRATRFVLALASPKHSLSIIGSASGDMRIIKNLDDG